MSSRDPLACREAWLQQQADAFDGDKDDVRQKCRQRMKSMVRGRWSKWPLSNQPFVPPPPGMHENVIKEHAPAHIQKMVEARDQWMPSKSEVDEHVQYLKYAIKNGFPLPGDRVPRRPQSPVHWKEIEPARPVVEGEQKAMRSKQFAGQNPVNSTDPVPRTRRSSIVHVPKKKDKYERLYPRNRHQLRKSKTQDRGKNAGSKLDSVQTQPPTSRTAAPIEQQGDGGKRE